MPGTQREVSRDCDAVVKHPHSWSESGRSSVPMWDSSDPERAPPPLPLNPGTQSPTTKSNTSATIAAAAQKFTEIARAAAPVSSYTRNPAPREEASPERSLIKGVHQNRMQANGTSNVRDLRAYLDGNRKNSHDTSPERPRSGAGSTPTASKLESKEYFSASPEKDGLSTPTPTSNRADPFKDTPNLRPSTRQRSIYGENTPPSATMLALQTMHVPEPFHDITNNRPSTPSATSPRVSSNYDFSAQLLNLTAIATNLQREMAQLSRRSKDNATDLISLKEATNARDEDLRKSMKDLSTAWTSTQNLLGPPPTFNDGRSRSASTLATPNFLDTKAFGSPPSATRPWQTARAASAHSFLEDHREGSPSPYSIEGAASVAMLEKIIREMVTKEGQERLLSTLSQLFEKSSKDNVEAAKKVEQLSDFIKNKSEASALVPVGKTADGTSKLDRNVHSPRELAMSSSAESTAAKTQDPFPNEEVMKTLNRIKESAQHAGGTTSEVKSIVRDLRGEVLGMGRELGRKLDQLSDASLNSALDRSIACGQDSLNHEEVKSIVDNSVAELKRNLISAISQDQSSRAMQLASVRQAPSGAEMYDVVKAAMAEHAERQLAKQQSEPNIDRDSLLETVREGLKDFEPNIELQQYGLERDEVLSVIKEGFEQHEKSRPEPASLVAPVDKGDVFEAVREALRDFRPPSPTDDQLQQLKDELLANVQHMLAEFQHPPAGQSITDDASKAAIIDAVKEGLVGHGPAAPREIEISREDLFDAVKASLDGTTIPFGGFGEQVLAQLHDLVDGMKVEFRQYSAASGRDTEQVLDAVKDGLENLRSEIEKYVDRAQDITGKDEIIDTVKGGLEHLRADVQGYCSKGPDNDDGKREMLDYIRAEFEHLHEALGSSNGIENGRHDRTAEIILAVNESMNGLKQHLDSNPRGHDEDEDKEEIFEAMKEEFEQLKSTILNAHMSDKSELVETIHDSMGSLYSKLNGSELSDGSRSTVEATMREEFGALKEMVHAGAMGEKDREAIVSAIHLAIERLRTQISGDQSDAHAEMLGAMRSELEAFKDFVGPLSAQGATRGFGDDNGEGTQGVVAAIENLHDHMSNLHREHSAEQIAAIQLQLDGLKESLGTSLISPAGSSTHLECLDQIRAGVGELREKLEKGALDGGVSTDLLECIRGEFENLRNSIGTSLVPSGGNEEFLDAIRLGLDDLRSDMQKKLDNPEFGMAHHNELLDTMNDGLEAMKSELTKAINKPLDMTVNYEILDTLKDGIASLRADMDRLKGTETPSAGAVVLADADGVERETPSSSSHTSETANKADMEKVEVLLAQLQIKVEAMGATVLELPDKMHHGSSASPSEDNAAINDSLISLEAAIRDVQASVTDLASRQPAAALAPEGVAMKEDTDAIETILLNTKAQLEELQLPNADQAVTKEQFDTLEAAVRLSHDTIDAIYERLDKNAAQKDDVAVVEVLAQDIKAMLDELKEKVCTQRSEDDKDRPVTRADFDVLGVICTEIKAKVTEIELPNAADAPSKEDLAQLQNLINDFRESHDKLKDSYESDIAITAKAFDDRKQESSALTEQIATVSSILEDMKTELLAKLGDGEVTISSLGDMLKDVEEKLPDVDPLKANIEELVTKVTEEFEKAQETLEAIKADNAEAVESALEKQAENKTAMIDELGAKLDTLFDGLMSKYDDAQASADVKAATLEEKIAAQEELMNSTKAMADDLRVSIDTLGGALTSFCETFPAKVEAMEDQNKTLFEKSLETTTKVDEAHASLLGEHAGTREDLTKVFAAVDGMQAEITEHNPRFMVKLEELAAIVGQHWEHSQQTAQAADQHAQSVRELKEQVRGLAEDSRTQAEDWKPQFEELKSNISGIPALMPAPVEQAPAVERYDDTSLHEKLDTLMGHAEKSNQSTTQLERLDQIHEKVMSTAAEVSAFVAMQAKQIMNDHENKEKEAEELALLLERRTAQSDHLEAELDVMHEEKESLQSVIEQLKAEKEALSLQKAQLKVDVASLETALHIRRDELHAMDAKADAIERRMLEGVMSQSRMLLLSKGTPKQSPKKKPGRDLRVPSDASQKTATSSASALRTGHAMAMKSRHQTSAANTTERRIMSLSQIDHNVPTGAHAFKIPPASLAPSGPKRSHSVKTHFLQRKASLGSKRLEYGIQEKENSILSEEDEEIFDHFPSRDSVANDLESNVDTTRRPSCASAAGSVRTFDTGTYMTGETPTEDGRRTSFGTYDPSEMSYGTGSYMTGSELDDRTSLGSTVNGQIGARHGREEEEHQGEGDAVLGAHEEVEEDETHGPLQLTAAEGMLQHQRAKSGYSPPSDSGLGSELPTAVIAASGTDYFK